MADTCRHCLRPKAESYEDFDDAHCLRDDRLCSVVAPYELQLAATKAQLTQAQAEIAALKLVAAQERAGNEQRGVLLNFERRASNRMLAELVTLRECVEASHAIRDMVDDTPEHMESDWVRIRTFDAARAKLKETTDG